MEKVAIVTGGSRGIGKACVLELAGAGYKVVIHYRSKPELAEELSKQLPDSIAIQADLTEDGACQDVVKKAKEHFGRIDVLVNNAGISIDQILPFAKLTDMHSLINTNLIPVFLMSKFCTKVMMRKKSGSIINISSVIGHTGNAGQSMYAATKSAITGFTKSIAAEVAKSGIRANCVAPGFIETEMTDVIGDEAKNAILNSIPLARLGSTEDIANAVTFLASDKASYITGTTLHVNGGMYKN